MPSGGTTPTGACVDVSFTGAQFVPTFSFFTDTSLIGHGLPNWVVLLAGGALLFIFIKR